MKKPKLKKGTKVRRWNGTIFEDGVVLSASKKMINIEWPNEKEKVERDLIKYQEKLTTKPITKPYVPWWSKTKEKITGGTESVSVWNWNVPFSAEETFETKIEGDWKNTYDVSGKLVSTVNTSEAHKKIFWFLRDPYELMTELGYKVTEDNAHALIDFEEGKYVDTYSWFVGACCHDKQQADEIIKWMMGPLKEIMIEREIEKLTYFTLSFHAPDFGELVSKITKKVITATMGKEALRMMFDGKKLEEILKDDKFKISSGGEMEKFIAEVLEANPTQVEELKAGKEKILPWLVGQVMKASRGKANAGEANKMIREKLGL